MTCPICEGRYGEAGPPVSVPEDLPPVVLVTDVPRDPEWVRDVWGLPEKPVVVPALATPTWDTPSAADAHTCAQHHLLPHLGETRVVASGATATAAVLGPGAHPVGKWLGRVMPVPALPGPSTSRRNRLTGAYLARSGLHGSRVDPVYSGALEGHQLRGLRQLVERADMVAWDLETDGLDPLRDGASILCMSLTVCQAGEIVGSYVVPGDLVGEVSAWDCWPDVMVAHNGKYDQLWMLSQLGRTLAVTYDTMLAEHLIDSEGPKGLKIVAAKYLRVADWSVDVGHAASLDQESLYGYAAMDTAATAGVYYAQQGLVDRTLLDDLLMPASAALLRAEEAGVGLDRDGACRLRDALTREEIELTREISEYGPASTPREMRHLLYDTLGLPVLERTPTGHPSVATSVLRRLDHPVAQAMAERQGVRKGISAFVRPWLDATRYGGSRLYSTFRLAGTATGRLSSGGAEGSSGINLQQIPRDKRYKSLISAAEGYTLIELDYSQIELRVAASLAGEETMIEIYREGGDIHRETAIAVSGKTNIDKSDRTKAKSVNFGFLYGMGARSFMDYSRDSYGVTVTLEEAEEARERFFKKYSGLNPWHQRVKTQATKNGFVKTLFGRVRYLDGIKYGKGAEKALALRQAVNTSVQSVASDCMILALGLIDRLLVTPKYGARIVATVHDSVLLEVPTARYMEVGERAKYVMEHLPLKHFGVSLEVPLEAGVASGDTWGGMKEW